MVTTTDVTPVDLIRLEAGKLSILKEAVARLTGSVEATLRDFHRRPVEAAPGKGSLHRIVLSSELPILGAIRKKGTALAVVQTEPGISLGRLIGLMHDGLVSEVELVGNEQ